MRAAFKLGTGSYGGFRNIFVDGLVVKDTYRTAIALESVDGGFLENVHIKNVVGHHVGGALFIRLGHRNKGSKRSTLKNISIQQMQVSVPGYKPDIGYPIEGPRKNFAHNVFPSSIVGLAGYPVENVRLEDIRITYEGTGDSAKAYRGVHQLSGVPQAADGYPEFSMFGELPAWGFYIRHVNGLEMKHISLINTSTDYRPAMVMDDVHAAAISHLEVPKVNKSQVIYFKDTSQVVLESGFFK